MQAYDSLGQESYANFLKHYNIEIKEQEVQDLRSLINALYAQSSNKQIFNSFYISYKIPQIGKEFDLLRFGKDYIVNIELKSNTTEEKIKKQLQRNRYYLSCIEKHIYNLTYVSETNRIYFLNENDSLCIVDINFLYNLLKNQTLDFVSDIDNLFNPSDFLVSPFNSTERFRENQYFLTHQQEDIKNQILAHFNNNTTPSFISVTGSAGTGKTLLIYDIVKELKCNKKHPLIIHCGYLNFGQIKLQSYGWDIIPIKLFNILLDFSKFDAIFVDEAQRLKPYQLEMIINKIQQINGNCIFSYDKSQTLAQSEEQSDIDSKINAVQTIKKYNLSEKIRTNKEIAIFIRSIFNKNLNLQSTNKGNIEINFFNNIDDAKNYLDGLDNQEWEVLRFTPSQYHVEHHSKYSDVSNKNSHRVIGQEFDNVTVTIDQYFTYNHMGELIYTANTYYHPVKMLFQNITRTRKRLNLVIINNESVLNRCMSVLKS